MAIRVPKQPLPGRRRKPAWPPQEENGKNGANGKVPVAEQAAEVGTGIVGWVDERTSASGFLRGFLFRIWRDRARSTRSWAIRAGADELDRRFWERHDVEVVERDLSEWVVAMRASAPVGRLRSQSSGVM